MLMYSFYDVRIISYLCGVRLVALSHVELINSRYACLVTERYYIVAAAYRDLFYYEKFLRNFQD